jgi:hypothetical protein
MNRTNSLANVTSALIGLGLAIYGVALIVNAVVAY